MASVHFTARVGKNGSVTLPKEAREALDLQAGDEVDFVVEAQARESEQDSLREALDIGLDQFERGAFTVYTKDTICELAEEVKAAGRARLRQTRETRAS